MHRRQIEALRRNREIHAETHRRKGFDRLPQRFQDRRGALNEQLRIVGKREQKASNNVSDAISRAKQWLPIEVIYAHGQGQFASPEHHRFMQTVEKILFRVYSGKLIVAFNNWRVRSFAYEMNLDTITLVVGNSWMRQDGGRRNGGTRHSMCLESPDGYSTTKSERGRAIGTRKAKIGHCRVIAYTGKSSSALHMSEH